MIIELSTGKHHSVYFQQLSQLDLKVFHINKSSRKQNEGWVFDWREPMKQGSEVFAIFTSQEPVIVQGLISLRKNDAPGCHFVEVANVETSPRNKSSNPAQKYAGVGKHLMAYACRVSVDSGFDVQFKSKTTSVGFYEKLGAKHIGDLLMYFNKSAATAILNRCGM